jgi:hypothetical protein
MGLLEKRDGFAGGPGRERSRNRARAEPAQEGSGAIGSFHFELIAILCSNQGCCSDPVLVYLPAATVHLRFMKWWRRCFSILHSRTRVLLATNTNLEFTLAKTQTGVVCFLDEQST